MIDTDDSNNFVNDDTQQTSLDDRLDVARSKIESSPEESVPLLDSVQRDVQALALFSKNETIDDISTKAIPFLATDHFLAMALGNLPVAPGAMIRRKENIERSMTLWGHFLERLQNLEILSKEETKEFHGLLEAQQQRQEQQNSDSNSLALPTNTFGRGAPVDRDAKILRYKAKQKQRQEIDKLKALMERRTRCGIGVEDEMDGHDLESLERSLTLTELHMFKVEALENWSQSLRELPMIERMIKIDSERQLKKYTVDGGDPEDPSYRGGGHRIKVCRSPIFHRMQRRDNYVLSEMKSDRRSFNQDGRNQP